MLYVFMFNNNNDLFIEVVKEETYWWKLILSHILST